MKTQNNAGAFVRRKSASNPTPSTSSIPSVKVKTLDQANSYDNVNIVYGSGSNKSR